jgi:ribonuclease HI
MRVFTDGACSSNGRPGSKAGFAVWFPEHPELKHSQRIPTGDPQTNQRAELCGIQKAVEILETNGYLDEDIVIYTDSDYSINCLTKWIPGWTARGWKTAEGNEEERLRPLPEVLQRPHRPARWSATAATNTNANVGRSCDARIAPPAKRSPGNSSQVHARAQIKSATREHTRSQATCCGGQQAITPRTERRAPDLSRCSRLPCSLPEPASARTHLKGSYRRQMFFT